jgi:hypothetical protein
VEFLYFRIYGLPRDKNTQHAENSSKKDKQDADTVYTNEVINVPCGNPFPEFYKLHFESGFVEPAEYRQRNNKGKNRRKKCHQSHGARASHKKQYHCAEEGQKDGPRENRIIKIIKNYTIHIVTLRIPRHPQ